MRGAMLRRLTINALPLELRIEAHRVGDRVTIESEWRCPLLELDSDETAVAEAARRKAVRGWALELGVQLTEPEST